MSKIELILYAIATTPLLLSIVAAITAYRIKKERYYAVYILMSLSFAALVATILLNLLLFGIGCWGCSGSLIPEKFLILYLLTVIFWIIPIQIKTNFMNIILAEIKPFLHYFRSWLVKLIKKLIYIVKSFNQYNHEKYDKMVAREINDENIKNKENTNK